jgi:hypothetical protein
LQADALAVAGAGLDAELDRLGAMTTPSPWQVGQAFEMRPVPPQRGQGMLNFMRPPICVTWPVPLHSGQVRGCAGRGLAVAGGADFLAVNLDAGVAAADGGPEIDWRLVFEIGAGLGTALRLAAAVRR